MYVIIRKFSHVYSMEQAARRAESGIGHMLKHSAGFRSYYVFDSGGGTAGSVTVFDSRDEALAANERALTWIRASLADVLEGHPEVTAGEILFEVTSDLQR